MWFLQLIIDPSCKSEDESMKIIDGHKYPFRVQGFNKCVSTPHKGSPHGKNEDQALRMSDGTSLMTWERRV